MMIRMKRLALSMTTVALGLTWAGGVLADSTSATVQEKLHVIYDPVSREVTRRVVRVFDPHPEMALDFVWEPAAGNWPGVSPEGFANGQGKLSW